MNRQKIPRRPHQTCIIQHYLDTEKIEQETQYDGLYAISTDLLDDPVSEILKVSDGRRDCQRWDLNPMYTRLSTMPLDH